MRIHAFIPAVPAPVAGAVLALFLAAVPGAAVALCLTIAPPPATAERDPYFAETERVESPAGPQSITRALLQDRRGDIWLASFEGLMRFDGMTFVNHTNRDGLRRTRVFTLLEDRGGDLWIGTRGAGAYRYDGETYTRITIEDGLASNRVACFFEDSAGAIWVGTDGGLSRIDGESVSSFTVDDGLTDGDVNSITADATGLLWIGTRGEACTFDGRSFRTVAREDGGTFTNTREIFRDREDRIWLAGNGGLWVFEDGIFTRLREEFVGHVMQDSRGDYWFCSTAPGSTRMELIRLYGGTLASGGDFETIHTDDGLVFDIMEDRDGAIWFGLLDGVGRVLSDDIEFFRRGARSAVPRGEK